MPGYSGLPSICLSHVECTARDISGHQGTGFPQRRVLRDWVSTSQPSGVLWVAELVGTKGLFLCCGVWFCGAACGQSAGAWRGWAGLGWAGIWRLLTLLPAWVGLWPL